MLNRLLRPIVKRLNLLLFEHKLGLEPLSDDHLSHLAQLLQLLGLVPSAHMLALGPPVHPYSSHMREEAAIVDAELTGLPTGISVQVFGLLIRLLRDNLAVNPAIAFILITNGG